MFDKIITWGELITIVLFVLGSILLFYLILAVSNLLKVLKSVNKLIDDNKDNIDKSLKDLPKITDNTEKATALIKDNLEGIDKIVEKVGSISTSVKDGIDTIQNDIILKAKSILEIVDAIKRLFEKRKAKSEKRRKTKRLRYINTSIKREWTSLRILKYRYQRKVPNRTFRRDTSKMNLMIQMILRRKMQIARRPIKR